jgi:hypothetical protein
VNNFLLLLFAVLLSGCVMGKKFTYDDVNNIPLGATTNEVAQIMPPSDSYRKAVGPAGFEAWSWFYSVVAGPLRCSSVIFRDGKVISVRKIDYLTTDELARIMAAINSHQILIGMTPHEVMASWGSPESKTQSVSEQTSYQAWFYPEHSATVSLYRKNDEPMADYKVTQWTASENNPDRTARRPKPRPANDQL